MRMRKKPNLPQRIEKCGDLHIAKPEILRGQWQEHYPQYRNLHLEIGAGRGRFTVETARLNPDTLLVALERVPDALIIGMERANKEDIRNIRFLIGDAADVTKLFAPGEVSRLYLNFSDPWPNNGHRKRRLTYTGFLSLYKEILCPDGEIHFKTDNDSLFEFSLSQFEEAGYLLSQVTRDLHAGGPLGVMTDYEMKFHEQGVSINRCVAKL